MSSPGSRQLFVVRCVTYLCLVKVTIMKNIFVKLFILYLANLINADHGRSDYKYYKNHDGWLKFHEVPMNWNEARLTCHYEGSVLATPTSDMIDTMTEMIKKNKVPSGQVFTGIHATFASRHFSSIAGAPLSNIPHKWADGEPNNYLNPEDCIALNQNGTLADIQCTDTLPFICYNRNVTSVLNVCGSYDDEYFLDNRTGSCYKFHRYPHSWDRAFMICEAEGGYLAVINSEVEAQVMRDIFTRNPKHSLPPSVYSGGAHIGFRDIDEHGEWVTVHGQSLKEAGYDTFGEDQPDNANDNQYCGNIFRSGLLDDIECHNKLTFICEKHPRNKIYDQNLINFLEFNSN